MSDSQKNNPLVKIFLSPIDYPLIGVPMLPLGLAAILTFLHGLHAEALVPVAVMAVLYVLGCLVALYEVISDRKFVRDTRKVYEERWREFCHWRSEFETQLGFYVAQGGEKQEPLMELERKMNALLADHAEWRRVDPSMTNAQYMGSCLAAMTYRLQEACILMSSKPVR